MLGQLQNDSRDDVRGAAERAMAKRENLSDTTHTIPGMALRVPI